MEPLSTIVTPLDWTHEIPVRGLFDTPRPIEVDVGCGKGRFLLARAAACPDTHFIGVERLLRRLRKIDRKAQRAGLTNIRLLRIEAAYAVQYLFPPESVRACYVFFPDPWPKRRHHRRRLFSPAFLDALHRILEPGGLIHAATDHADYFTQIESLLTSDARFERIETFTPPEEQRTDFELIFLANGETIGRCSFRKVQA